MISSNLATLILVLCALFLLWYPVWEDERTRRRRVKRTHDQWRIDFYLEYGWWPSDDPTEDLLEWFSWRDKGRGQSWR